MPIRRAVLMMRQAISPRLAIRMRLNMRRALDPGSGRPRRLAAAPAESQSGGAYALACPAPTAAPVRCDPLEHAQVGGIIAGGSPGRVGRATGCPGDTGEQDGDALGGVGANGQTGRASMIHVRLPGISA